MKQKTIKKMKKICILITLIFTVITSAQTLTGHLKHHAGQQISLSGFNYYQATELAKDTIDAAGNFTLNYPKDYKGMGVLKTQDNSSFILVLTEKNINFTGNHLKEPNSIVFENSLENINFISYAKSQGLYRNALSAWKFLDDLYQKEELFVSHTRTKSTIEEEQQRIQKKDAAFIAGLDAESYLRWFIPYRKLVQEMPYIVRKETNRIPKAIQQFRTTDFKHHNFKTSGLYKELIEGHYMLLENMGQSLDSINVQMNLSTKYLINNLQENDSLLNTVSNNLFNYFEKRSLFSASEYLSVSLLTNNQCSLTEDLAAKLESYRKMKVGNIAPDIELKSQKSNSKSLYDIKTNKLVVFGASWCPNCKTEALELLKLYDTWKAKNIEIVYVSIDTDKAAFETAYKNAPWQTYCDFKGWDTQAAKDYYITGTPSYFLLDKDQKIIARPNSIMHVNVLIDNKL
jgi:peroxiredoxin/nicotinic acid mononucleotide adenylyltransferase